MSDSPCDEFDRLEQVADSFVSRLRSGERPKIEDYLQKYPELASQLTDLLPAIVLLERHAEYCESDGVNHRTTRLKLPASGRIGEFTIVREIGRGGMGVVYEAVQESLGRHVALKVLPHSALMNEKHLERFRFESRAAARLHHPHIVPVFGVGEVDGLHYYAMQFIQGHSLDEVIGSLRQWRETKRTDPLPARADKATRATGGDNTVEEFRTSPANSDSHAIPFADGLTGIAFTKNTREFYHSVARIGVQIAEALTYAHSEGVLHRDIKPSNLLLDSNGNIWVADFGLAKAEGTNGLTQTGDFVGTLRYMAPERLEGSLDRRSDVYSLGATLYELATLQSFYETNSQARLIDQILNQPPPAPSRVGRSIPRDLETIILKAIAKEPALRYRTAEEMAADLRRFLEDKPILSQRPSAREQLVRCCRRNPLVATLTAAVAALLIAAISILTYSNGVIRRQAAAKDAALVAAHHAVHQMLTRVANEKFSDMPMGHPLRLALLEDAVKTYEGLLTQGDADFDAKQHMADVLHMMAGLQRELGRHRDAGTALVQSAHLFESLIELDPKPPYVREALARVYSDLAYTWQFDTESLGAAQFPVEQQYRRALEIYRGIEHEFPGRRQPTTLCLRYLAEYANRRGDRDQAIAYWKDSISSGQAYLELQPTHESVQIDLCWACLEYLNKVLRDARDKVAEADTVLSIGEKHIKIILLQNPDSTPGIDAQAFLHFNRALLNDNLGKTDDAIPAFRLAIQEIELLCESVPWNSDYWNSAQWFHRESVRRMQKANRDSEVDSLIETITAWLHKIDSKNFTDVEQQKGVAQTRQVFIALLRSIGREGEADRLASALNH